MTDHISSKTRVAHANMTATDEVISSIIGVACLILTFAIILLMAR